MLEKCQICNRSFGIVKNYRMCQRDENKLQVAAVLHAVSSCTVSLKGPFFYVEQVGGNIYLIL